MGLHNLLRRRNPLTNARMGDSILSSHQKPQWNISAQNPFFQAQNTSPHSLQQWFTHPDRSSCCSVVALGRQWEGWADATSRGCIFSMFHLNTAPSCTSDGACTKSLPSHLLLAMNQGKICHPLVLIKTEVQAKPRRTSGKAQKSKAINKYNRIIQKHSGFFF